MEKTKIRKSKKSSAEFCGNRREAAALLISRGYKTSVTAVYAACRSGALPVMTDGRVAIADALRWVQTLKSATGGEQGALSLAEEKLKLECSILRQKEEKQAFDMERERGKYISVADAELALASRAAALEAQLGHMAATRAIDWIDIVNGEEKKVNDLIDSIASAISDCLDEYARCEEINIVISR